MGYSTHFAGEFLVTPTLEPAHIEYLKKFNETRRMKRDEKIAETLPDPVREAVGLPVGEQGAYFVGGVGFMGQESDASTKDYNCSPTEQPGLWCQWVPTDDGDSIVWDEGEKFYEYVEWIEYLIEHFLGPWGYKLNGSVEWEGDERGDLGLIVIKDNEVDVKYGRIVYD